MASAKIFRINYKSDFILTLESDAGWMTPFCIKFWTGAPSQAYYVGWDGETYDHCSFDPSEPTKLQVQFDDHHLPIGDLKYQVAYHFNVADFPNDTEDEVINAANITTEIDGETYQVMLDFTGETAPEIQFALPAYANEAQRIANEQQRIANETQRIANEETRIQHEQQRIAAEQTRQQNEQQRINQEQARVNEYATLKADAVAATGAANDAAALANQKAQLAADKAALAQAAADLANAKAQLAADKAALAASAAQLANDKAALAQQKAEYAQTQGGYAKDQGDYAKAQGDTALADHQRAEADHGIAVDDHTQAGNDHTRAESDHGIAVGDHTQAGNDHTRAESDHTTASADHTQAGNDHTRAESDHTTASADHTQAGADHTRAESDHTRAESDHAAVEVYVDSLGAFDISAYHATGGVLAKYADLTAALGTDGANIPEAIRKGGMSVKFVQSSDNKYLQFRYMSSSTAVADFTNVANWQGVDDEPTAGSDNLVKSGGVYTALNALQGIVRLKETYTSYNANTGDLSTTTQSDYHASQKISIGNIGQIQCSIPYNVILYYAEGDSYLGYNRTGIPINGTSYFVVGFDETRVFTDGGFVIIDNPYSVEKVETADYTTFSIKEKVGNLFKTLYEMTLNSYSAGKAGLLADSLIDKSASIDSNKLGKSNVIFSLFQALASDTYIQQLSITQGQDSGASNTYFPIGTFNVNDKLNIILISPAGVVNEFAFINNNGNDVGEFHKYNSNQWYEICGNDMLTNKKCGVYIHDVRALGNGDIFFVVVKNSNGLIQKRFDAIKNILGVEKVVETYTSYNVNDGTLSTISASSYHASQKIAVGNADSVVCTGDVNAYMYYDSSNNYLGWNRTGILEENTYWVCVGLNQNGSFSENDYLSFFFEDGQTIAQRITNVEDNFDKINPWKNKTFAVLGDSLSETSVWENKFATLKGAVYVSGYSKGGESTLSPSGNCGMDRALKLLNEQPNINAIFIQNINDMYVTAGDGQLSDLPYMMTQNVLSETVYGSQEQAVQALSTEIANISTRKVGTMLRIPYGTTAKKVTIGNAPSANGTITITIGTTDYAVTVNSAMSIQDVQNAILAYDYSGMGYSDVASSTNAVLFTDTENRGSSAPVISINAGTTGIILSITDSTSVSYVARCFISKDIAEWTDMSKWVEISSISRYSLYKGLISWLQSNFPTAYIFMLGLPRYAWDNNPNYYKYEDGTWDWDSYRPVAAIQYLFDCQKTVADYMRIPYVDVVNACAINIYNASTFYPKGDVHPNTNGYERFGETVARLLK